MNKVFLISNIDRSGSSMVVRCLEAGGMDVAFSASQESLNTEFNTPGYIPNPNGFYAAPDDIEDVNIIENYNGRAFKFPFRHLLTLPETGTYYILFLKRNPDEIRASMSTFAPYELWGKDATILELYDTVIDCLLDNISKRANCIVTVLNYADIVANPQKEFQKLIKVGWSFDVEKASQIVDNSLYRFKLEQR